MQLITELGSSLFVGCHADTFRHCGQNIYHLGDWVLKIVDLNTF